MAKAANKVPTVTLTLSATPQLCAYLDQLAESGIYGKNRAEAALRLVEQAIEQRIERPILRRETLPSPTEGTLRARRSPSPPAEA
jgi:hypothetical protein